MKNHITVNLSVSENANLIYFVLKKVKDLIEELNFTLNDINNIERINICNSRKVIKLEMTL